MPPPSAVKTWELKPEDLPLRIVFGGAGGVKDYVLIKTKQGKLLLNKSVEEPR
jgi:hypothetical protein